MFSPGNYLDKEGFFLVQPYDRDKTPIVFVHGLMSVPQMWIPVMAAIESDPALRGKFQFWVFAYPTGNPIAYSALQLRQALESVYKVYPRTRDMVIMDHSLGGDLTHLQVINSGDVLVKGIFKENAPKIMAQPASSLVEQALISRRTHGSNGSFSLPRPIVAPRSLSILSEELVQRSFIYPGPSFLKSEPPPLKRSRQPAGLGKSYVPNSINALEPTNPLLIYMNEVPIRTPFHSIMGLRASPRPRWRKPATRWCPTGVRILMLLSPRKSCPTRTRQCS